MARRLLDKLCSRRELRESCCSTTRAPRPRISRNPNAGATEGGIPGRVLVTRASTLAAARNDRAWGHPYLEVGALFEDGDPAFALRTLWDDGLLEGPFGDHPLTRPAPREQLHKVYGLLPLPGGEVVPFRAGAQRHEPGVTLWLWFPIALAGERLGRAPGELGPGAGPWLEATRSFLERLRLRTPFRLAAIARVGGGWDPFAVVGRAPGTPRGAILLPRAHAPGAAEAPGLPGGAFVSG